jgi:hypothetical protein
MMLLLILFFCDRLWQFRIRSVRLITISVAFH